MNVIVCLAVAASVLSTEQPRVDGARLNAHLEALAEFGKTQRGGVPDGRMLLYRQIHWNRQNDIFVLPLDGGKPTPFLTSLFNELHPVFSPSGRWVAFTSNESGRDEVYAVRFPDGKSRVQISTEGGTQPVWRGDEKELFYLAPGDQLMSIAIDTSSGTLKPGAPKFIAEVTLRPSRQEGREYDVSRDARSDRASRPITMSGRARRRATAAGTAALWAHLDARRIEHHDAPMRTTLTLDDDVASDLRKEARRSGRPFKEVVNETIRRGLAAGIPPGRRPKRFRVRPVPGRFRPGIDLMRLNRLVDELEIERARALVIRDR